MNCVFFSINNDLSVETGENKFVGRMLDMHYHNGYEIYILEKGHRTYVINDTTVSLEQNDVALIRPYEIHFTDGGRYKRHLILFKEEYLDKFFTAQAKALLLKCFEYKKIHVGHADLEILLGIVDSLGENPEDFMCFARLLELLNTNMTVSLPSDTDSKNTLVSQITEFIGKNYTAIKSLEEISDRFYITKYYLCRIFKEVTGVTVMQYINLIKIQSACEMLATTKKPVEEIALQSGFNSSMYFCKTFKSIIGTTPSLYRKSRNDNKASSTHACGGHQ